MATWQPGDLQNLVLAADKERQKYKVQDIAAAYQNTIAVKELMNANRIVVKGGAAIELRYNTAYANNARDVGWFEQDNINITDSVIVGNVPWRNKKSGWAVEEREMIAASGSHEIFDIVKQRKQDTYCNLAEQQEDSFWSQVDSATDTLSWYGLRNWLVYNATTGFNGGNHTYFSSGIGGISRTTYAGLKNYTFLYVAVTQTDLLDSARKAAWSCNWKSPMPNPLVPGMTSGEPKMAYYTTWDIRSELMALARAQNDDLRFELDPDKGTFQGHQIVAVPYLQTNDATADPFIGLNWNAFKTYYMRGFVMREEKPHKNPNASTVIQSEINITGNFVMTHPRSCFLGAKSTWH